MTRDLVFTAGGGIAGTIVALILAVCIHLEGFGFGMMLGSACALLGMSIGVLLSEWAR